MKSRTRPHLFRVFVAYALELEQLPALKRRIAIARSAAAEYGVDLYYHVEDDQGWNLQGPRDFHEVLSRAFAAMDQCEAVLLDTTSKANSKRTGLNIEAGYARGRGLPIYALYQTDDPPRMTMALARAAEGYSDEQGFEDACRKLFSMLVSDYRSGATKSNPE